MDRTRLEALAHMSDADLEKAPFGVIVVNPEGIIEQYNAYESRLAHLERERVVGKSFFHHVAPCTAVAAFEGRFLEFLEFDDVVSDSFAYFFPFDHEDVNVLVTFVKRTVANTYLIVIEVVDAETIEPLQDVYSQVIPRS